MQKEVPSPKQLAAESPQSCDSTETVASCSLENNKTSSNINAGFKKSPDRNESFHTQYAEPQGPEKEEKVDFKEWEEGKNVKNYSNPESVVWKNQAQVKNQLTEEPAYDQLHSESLPANKEVPSIVRQSYNMSVESNAEDCKADSERLSSDTQSEYSPVTIVDGSHVRGYYPSHFYYPQQGYVQGAAMVNKSIFYPKSYPGSYQQPGVQQPAEKAYHVTENTPDQQEAYGGYYGQQGGYPPQPSNFQQHSIITSNEYPTY